MNSRKSNIFGLVFLCCLALLPASCLDVGCDESDVTCNPVAAWTYLLCQKRIFSGEVQGCPLELRGIVTTVAGQVAVTGAADGIGAQATMNLPWGASTDGAVIYLVNAAGGSVRQVDLRNFEVRTLVTGLMAPRDVMVAGSTLYIANAGARTILSYNLLTGVLSTLAGTGVGGTVNGPGATAQFTFPSGIASDGTSLFITDSSEHTVRKIEIATNTVSTFAGVAGSPGFLDAVGTLAQFRAPLGIATDGTYLYVAETVNNHTIRRISIATQEVTTLAGTVGVAGSVDGFGTAAQFNIPSALATDGTFLYVADDGNSAVRMISLATGQVTTLSGQVGVPGSADGVGTQATHSAPRGITSDGARLYVSDSTNHTLRMIE